MGESRRTRQFPLLPSSVSPIFATSEVSDAVALRQWVPDLAERDVYVCGPQAWNDLVLRDLDALGVPRAQVHVESFAW